MEEEDEGNGLEFDFLALSDRPDDLLPRPLLLSVWIYPPFPYLWTDDFCLVISPQMLPIFSVGILIITLDPKLTNSPTQNINSPLLIEDLSSMVDWIMGLQKCVHVPIPRTWRHVTLYDRWIMIADGIKDANQQMLTSSWTNWLGPRRG